MKQIQERISKAFCVEFSDKLDGSMQSARYYNGQIVMSGSQAVDPSQSWRLRDGYSRLTENHRKMIEEHRKKSVSDEMNRRARFDKTSRSKDVIIEAKDKRIATLMAENEKLKAEIALLRGMLYADKDSITSRTCSRREETSNSGG